MLPIFTIGYEGTDIPRFLEVLRTVGVQTLIDVRAVPISRKKGFSKSALKAHLADAGIDYVHFSALGNPKSGRDAAHAGNFKRFIAIYKKHFNTAKPQEAFQAVLNLAADKSVCLMCFERDVKTCHRAIITAEMESHRFECIDLVGDDPDRYVRNTEKLPGRNSRQSLAAAE